MTTVKRGLGANAAFNRRQKRSITRHENNALTIVETWQCRGVDFLTTIPAQFAPHPDYPSTFLTGQINSTEESDFTTYVLTYTGFDESSGGSSSPDDSPPRYWWEGVDRTTPIEYLERGTKTFAALVASSKAAGASPLDTKKLFIGFPKGAVGPTGSVLRGITSFFEFGGVWNCERFSSIPPDMTKSCTYTATPPGSPPAIDADADWLYLTPSYEKLAAGVYFIKEKWIPSEGGTGSQGWKSDIYDAY